MSNKNIPSPRIPEKLAHDIGTVSAYVMNLFRSLSSDEIDLEYCRDLAHAAVKKIDDIKAACEAEFNSDSTSKEVCQ